MERVSYQDIPEGMFENLMGTENCINNSSLDMQLLEIIRLRVSQLNSCAYCVDMHYKELRHLGETELRLSSICVWYETPYFSSSEAAALRFTDQLTKLTAQGISDETYSDVQKHFNKTEICYLTLAISQINTWTRLMRTFKFTPGKYKVTSARDQN